MKKILILIFMILALLIASCSPKPKEEEKKPPKSPYGEDGVVTLLLDAGHGFGDIGCTSQYLQGKNEHELTIDFVTKLKGKLEALGFTVLLTHDGISYPDASVISKRSVELGLEFDPEKMSDKNGVFDAYERAIYANLLHAENEIDLFLSIHVNASADSDTATGFEIDYCAENDSSDMSAFAFDSICHKLEEKYPSRRFKQFADSWDMSFIVTKYTNMPSILFETGFASTQSDAQLLLDEDWRDGLMSALADGIKDYFELG